MSINMPHSDPVRPRIKKLLLRLTILLVVFVISTAAVVLTMHSASLALTEDSQEHLLPAIHEHQRAAINLERLERMGDLVLYGGNVTLIRKNALAAQVLAFQPSFNFSPVAKETVRAAFELLREVRRTRQMLLSSQFERLSDIEQRNLLLLDKSLQVRWSEYKQELFELQNKIISDATSLQEKNMQQITATNNMILVVAGTGMSLLLVVIFIIGYSLYKHLITPVTEASKALLALEQGKAFSPAPARYQELNNIHQAVANLSSTLNKLHTMATRDSLTGCANRGYFMELAQKALSKAHRQNLQMAIVMLDVDHFKKVNDQYGHAVGDDTLQLTTKWIQTSLPEDAIIGRLGGEEFALILPRMDAQQAVNFSDSIRKKIAANSSDSSTVPAITVSLGVQVVREPTDEIDTLLSQADKALYEAKTSGRNQVVLSKESAVKESTVKESTVEESIVEESTYNSKI